MKQTKPNVTRPIPDLRDKDVARFWSKVEKTDACWIFHAREIRGYRLFSIGRGQYMAHRVSFKLATNIDPVGFEVCHECDNPPCVRPDHLFKGTRADNVHDMFRKNRGRPKGGIYPRGEEHHNAVLTALIVSEMRRLHADFGWSLRQIAREFGISRPTARQAVQRLTWSHVT